LAKFIFCTQIYCEDHLLSFVLPSPEQTLPLAYPLLASLMAAEEHFVKAKSELRLCDLAENGSDRYSTQKPVSAIPFLEIFSTFYFQVCAQNQISFRREFVRFGYLELCANCGSIEEGCKGIGIFCG
jgi:hypothetical protein